MDPQFWHERWQNQQIAFHEKVTHAFLEKYFNKLGLPQGARVFVPLCGKSLDMIWLLSQGYRVVGAELVQSAVDQFFEEWGVKPRVSKQGTHLHYQAENLDLWVGSVFDLSAEALGPVDGVYDRAALVALPQDMRVQYAQHLREISRGAPQLLITFDYDQSQMDGPPFSLSDEEVTRHYGKHYDLKLLETTDVPGGLKGKCTAKEKAWLLT